MIVPPIGPEVNSVAAEAILADGSTELLEVSTYPDGYVVVDDWGSDAQGDPSSGGGSTPSILDNQCSDNFYQLLGKQWTINTSLNWRWKAGSQPADVSESTALLDIKNAGFNIINARNECGRADSVNIWNVYDGTTTGGVNISTTSTCTTSDGKSRVSFGDLASSHIGYACVFSSGSLITSADFKLNKFDGHDWYAGAPPFDCVTKQRYNIQAVATHEWGHMYGLWHYDSYREIDHPWLTMSPSVNGPCQNSEITLGLGDMLGLEYMY